jgi:hypothetical protein
LATGEIASEEESCNSWVHCRGLVARTNEFVERATEFVVADKMLDKSASRLQHHFAVPKPATLALLCGALLGFGAIRRRATAQYTPQSPRR